MENDNRVRLVQLLCGPKRHAIMAFPYVPGISASDAHGDDIVLDESNAIAYVQDVIAGWLAAKTINPWCGLCGAAAASWQYEDQATRFRSLREAWPELKATEEKNLEARRLLGEINDRRN